MTKTISEQLEKLYRRSEHINGVHTIWLKENEVKELLTTQQTELKKMIEGKRKDTATMTKNLPEGNGLNYAIARGHLQSACDYNQGIEDALSELNHQ